MFVLSIRLQKHHTTPQICVSSQPNEVIVLLYSET